MLIASSPDADGRQGSVQANSSSDLERAGDSATIGDGRAAGLRWLKPEVVAGA